MLEARIQKNKKVIASIEDDDFDTVYSFASNQFNKHFVYQYSEIMNSRDEAHNKLKYMDFCHIWTIDIRSIILTCEIINHDTLV